jgi:hypothetical protein
MNRNEAYQACHEIMLSCPKYVPIEADGVSYVLIQIADREEAVAIATHLVNPAIPPEGDVSVFVDLSLDQQIGIITLANVSKFISRIHKKLELLQKLSNNNDDGDIAETIKQLLKLTSALQDSETEDL